MSHWKIMKEKETELYFLTATIIEWTPIFTSPKYSDIIIQSLKYCQRAKELRIAGYVIMPNHIHMIVAGTLVHPLSDTMRDFKQFTARKIISKLKDDRRINELMIFQKAAMGNERGNTHKVWIEGNHPILVEEGFMFKEKLIYIHNNPVRAKIVQHPENYLYSSARNYAGLESMLEIEMLTTTWKTTS